MLVVSAIAWPLFFHPHILEPPKRPAGIFQTPEQIFDAPPGRI